MANKISFILFLLLLNLNQLMAQSPAMINYQGVAANAAGAAIANQNIAIRATIRQSSANGTLLYSEERTVMTDAGGLFNFQIGGTGTSSLSGSWAAIAWDNGAKFLQIEMDPANGTNFVNMGTQQLVSIPYAEYANMAGGLIPTATINPNQINAGGATTNKVLKYNGTNWVPATDASGFSLPQVAINGSSESFKIYNFANGICLSGATGTGYAVVGECAGNSGNGIRGLANGATSSPIGVYGEAANGTAVKGYANNAGSIGVFGSSLAGTGVKATSFTGTALDVVGDTKLSGDLKISGGNTNPSKGAVLTSDASGNAVWKKSNVQFKGKSDANQTINQYTNTIVTFDEVYDPGGNFNPLSAAVDPNTFIAPVSGFYHISSRVKLYSNSAVNNLDDLYVYLYINGAHYMRTVANASQNSINFSEQFGSISENVHLNAGDKITILVQFTMSGSSSAFLQDRMFCGHLVSED